MKSRWYFGFVITALAFFVVSQQQITVPNQEIVLQFSDNQKAATQAEDAIFIIKTQLKSIGIKDIQVLEQKGVLKIAYYSDKTVESVKTILLEEQLVYLINSSSQSQNPLDEDYNLDVYEIKKPTESGVGFDGKFIVEVKQEYTRASQLTMTFSAIAENVSQLNQCIKVAQKVNTNISISVDKGTFNIPEVRAGPTA